MSSPALGRRSIQLAIATAWWVLVALVSAASARSRGGAGGWDALATALAAVAFWIPLTVAVFALVEGVPLRRPGLARALAIHVVGATAVVVLRALWIYGLDPWVGFYPQPPRLATVLMHSVENNLFVYWLFVGVGHAAIYARDAVERSRTAAALEAALARAEQAALAATVEPHFLFNTLSAIAELVHRDPDAADRAIVQLAGLLRRLVDDRRQEVTLAEELAFTRDYLAIEALRFGDRLAVRWDVPDELLATAVPRLTVQPLVDNAVRHGLARRARVGHLTIAARRDGADRIAIAVTDDGAGLAPSAAERGLATVRARLARLYGAAGELRVGPAVGGGARAELVVPA